MSSLDSVKSFMSYEWDLPGDVPSSTTTSPWQSPICEPCKSLFTDDFLANDEHRKNSPSVTRTGQDLQASAEVCHLCYLRWSRLTAAEKSNFANATETLTLYSYVPELVSMYFSPGQGDGIHRESIDLLTVPSDSNPIAGNLSFTNNSYPSWEISKQWISDCSRSHPTCQRWGSHFEKRLPTRLIDLGSNPTTIKPRVCITKSLDISTPYTTLSHCWGKLHILVLETATLEEMEKQIDVSRLTKTFREAMEVTRRLGVRYLWIDSLCIIQDSTEDWLHESQLMKDVYRHSFCKLLPRHPLMEMVAALPLDTFKTFSHVSWILATVQSYQRKCTRGWVVQEIALAPRIIYFGERRMYWECLERSICENFCPWSREAEKLAARISRSRILPSDEERAKVYQSIKVRTNVGSDYDRWGKLVELYTSCELTLPEKDKLVAIAGIARTILPNDTYLAGLWNENLIEHLRWTKGPQQGLDRSTRTWRAPSWSWASVDGPIKYPEARSNAVGQAIRIVETHTTPVTIGDPYGQVVDAFICAIGVLAKFTYTTSSNRNGSSREFLNGFECTILSDEQRFTHKSILYCLPLNLHMKLLDGLIIEPCEGIPGRYIRRGYFKLEGDDYYDPDDDYNIPIPLKSFKRECSSKQMKGSFAENDYEGKEDDSEDGLPQYRIKLV